MRSKNYKLELSPCLFDAHLYEMRRLAHELIDKCGRDPNDHNKLLLPFIQTAVDNDVPGCLRIVILCNSWDEVLLSDFILSSIRYNLIQGKAIQPSKFSYSTFQVAQKEEQAVYVCEIYVDIKNSYDYDHIQTQLPQLIKFFESGLRHPHSIPSLIEKIPTVHSVQSLEICIQGFRLLEKWKGFKFESFLDEMQSFLASATPKFKKHRYNKQILRAICSALFLRQQEEKLDKIFIDHSHVRVRIFSGEVEYFFGVKRVLAICALAKGMGPYELFRERHVLQALRSIDPAIQLTKGSVVCYNSAHDGSQFIYLEVEKEDGLPFTMKEIAKIRENLDSLLEENIERVMPRLVMIRNEEEIMKNLLSLSQEITDLKDAPQVIVSFESQSVTHLFFIVTIVRPFHDGMPSFKELIHDESEYWFCVVEKELFLSERSPFKKQGIVVRLGVKKSERFVRRDATVNLYRAHHAVLEYLKERLGNIREYTGGIILQQNELFKQLLDKFPAFKGSDAHVMEDYIYSINPVEAQLTLPLNVLENSFKQFLRTFKQKRVNSDIYLVQIESQDDYTYVAIRFPGVVDVDGFHKKLEETTATKLIYTSLKKQGYRFLSYIVKTPSDPEKQAFCTALEDVLKYFAKEDSHYQKMKLAMGVYPETLDPRVSLGVHNVMCLKMLFEGLMRLDNKGKPVCALAESYEISKDRKIYTFQLRKAKWSNGNPITAHDFAYAWKQVISPYFSTNFGHIFSCIQNAEKIMRSELPVDELGVKVIDDLTLQVELESPVSHFLDLLTLNLFFPVNRRADARFPDWPNRTGSEYVCNGPFMLFETAPNKSITLVKNPHYWNHEEIHLEDIHIQICSDQVSKELFDRGQSDWVGRPLHLNALTNSGKNEEDHFHEVANSLMIIYSMYINTGCPILSHRKFRQAMSYALDRTEICNKMDSYYLPAQSMMAPSFAKTSNVLPQSNISTAKRLLSEVMTELGISHRDIPKFSVLFGMEYMDTYGSMLQEIQYQLKENLGIKISLDPLPNHLARSRCLRVDYHLFFGGWIFLINTPFYLLDAFKSWHNHWHSPLYHDLIERAYCEEDNAKQELYLEQLETLLMEELPHIPISLSPMIYKKNPRLKGVIGEQLGNVDFHKAHFDWSDEDIRNRIHYLTKCYQPE